ncbi:hypothetical protein ACFE04_025164 [Oxalis oulophora]
MEDPNTQNTLATTSSTSLDRLKLNVGGKLFESTVSTLQSGGPDSLLFALSTTSTTSDSDPIFIDREPDIFSVLLYLLRSRRLPSSAANFSNQELTDEAIYYGIDSCLRAAMKPPPLLGIDAAVVTTVIPAADGLTSAFTAAANDGSLLIAHGGQISSYDWSLSHTSTVRTHLEDITSIRRVWEDTAAVGSQSAAGLHFYDFSSGRHVGSVHWTDSADPRIYKARVAAINESGSSVFASFDCPHRENCILVVDKSTLQVSSELGRQPGSSSKNMVAGKLTLVESSSLIVGSGVSSGAFGYSGYIRIWDVRSGKVVWETNEPGSGRSSRYGDSFADVDVDADDLTLFKLCSKSGDLAMADVRKLSEDPWVYMEDKNPLMHNSDEKIGGNKILHFYKNQVFVGRDGGLEVWSTISGEKKQSEESNSLFRRNFMDKVEDAARGVISRIEGGGDRLFVSRENVEGVEVWETSHHSGAISVL